MRITDLKTFVVGNPPPHFGGRYFVFLKLVTDGGIEGVGEIYGVPFHPEVVARMTRDVFERCVAGADPFKIERLWRVVYSSGYSQRPDVSVMGILSGLEMACWDIVGKELDRPVYELLGGRVHERLRSYSYLYPEAGEGTEVYSDAELAAERAAAYAPEGLHRGQVRPGRTLLRLRSASAVARGARPHRALRQDPARGGRQPVRSVVRDPRPDDRGRRDPSRAAAGAVRPVVVRGADPARDAGGDGQGRKGDHDPDRDRRAPRDQVRVRPRARDAARPRSCRWRSAGSAACSRPRRSPAWPRRTTPRSRPHLYCGPIEGAANIQLAACSPNFLILESIQTWGGFHAEILKEPIRLAGRLRHPADARPASASS